ncbi:MAG: hypothetical protein LQ347_006995, partial [Umbilicaria vellea]
GYVDDAEALRDEGEPGAEVGYRVGGVLRGVLMLAADLGLWDDGIRSGHVSETMMLGERPPSQQERLGEVQSMAW